MDKVSYYRQKADYINPDRREYKTRTENYSFDSKPDGFDKKDAAAVGTAVGGAVAIGLGLKKFGPKLVKKAAQLVDNLVQKFNPKKPENISLVAKKAVDEASQKADDVIYIKPEDIEVLVPQKDFKFIKERHVYNKATGGYDYASIEVKGSEEDLMSYVKNKSK